MRSVVLVVVAAFTAVFADEPTGKVVEVAGMKSSLPAEWKAKDKPGEMRSVQVVVPKAEGDSDDADLSVFPFPKGQGGSIADNLKRQTAKFQPAKGKDKVEQTTDDKFKLGTLEATYADIKGNYLKKAFPMAKEATPMADWRMLYVAVETKDGLTTLWLLGPAKTVDKHKKGFDEWLKNFK